MPTNDWMIDNFACRERLLGISVVFSIHGGDEWNENSMIRTATIKSTSNAHEYSVSDSNPEIWIANWHSWHNLFSIKSLNKHRINLCVGCGCVAAIASVCCAFHLHQNAKIATTSCVNCFKTKTWSRLKNQFNFHSHRRSQRRCSEFDVLWYFEAKVNCDFIVANIHLQVICASITQMSPKQNDISSKNFGHCDRYLLEFCHHHRYRLRLHPSSH